MNKCHAYWNTSKLCWEVWLEELQYGRLNKVFKHANVATKILTENGIKFVEASYNVNNKRPMLLIADPGFWVANETEIFDWLVNTNINYYLNGMLLEFDNAEDKMMFVLRWS